MRTIFPAAEKIYDMKKIIILIVCVLSACFAAAQEPVPVLTLGTFHFDFPNLDQVQYAESEQIDVLNPVYQNEIETLVGLLEKFAPTIIVIERPVKMQFETDSLFLENSFGHKPFNRIRIVVKTGFETDILLAVFIA